MLFQLIVGAAAGAAVMYYVDHKDKDKKDGE